MAENFDAARDQGVVLRAFRTRADDADDLEAVFVAAAVGGGEHFRTIRIADNLHETLAVAKIDEDHAAMVAATMGPTVEGHSLADEGLINQARVHGSHKSSQSCWPQGQQGMKKIARPKPF